MQAQEITQAAPATEVQAPSEPAKAVKRDSGFGVFFADLAVTAVIAALAAFAVLRFAPQWLPDRPQQAQQMAVVDMEGLSRAHILGLTEQVRAGELQAREMPAKTQAFAQALMDRVHKQTEKGVIVLNASAILAAPAEVIDLTPVIREEMQTSGEMAKRKTDK